MDTYRDFPSEFEPVAGAAEAGESDEVGNSSALDIGTDERRMHVRAYNYWVSLLDGRDFPSIEDLEPADLVDFAPNSVLLDFTGGRDNPATPYVGAAIRQECDLPDEVRSIDDVPSRSLLSRLTDHYMQIIANRAPVGFEAEFENQRDETICYRGILMPFSSDGDTIDFIYGVMNWKKLAQQAPATATLQPRLPAVSELEAEAEGEFAAEEEAFDPPPSVEVPMLSEMEQADQGESDFESAFEIAVDENAGLGDRLWVARESAQAVRESEGRSREALYRALSRAYDFALAAREDPADYAELLDESGVKAQARAPMTAVVKLVFGIDYDKARLTEYAAALSNANRQEVGLGGFLDFIEAKAGGLKALVAAEREARRPAPKTDTKIEKARQQLRSAPAMSLEEISGDEEFALVLTRRSSDGVHEAVAVVEDPALVERAIRRAGA
jgi:hypothetical protein